MSKIISNIDWLDYMSSNNNHRVLKEWKYSRDLFFTRYFILNDENFLIILDKKNYTSYQFPKAINKFKIQFNKQETSKDKKIFSLGNIEIIKRDVV